MNKKLLIPLFLLGCLVGVVFGVTLYSLVISNTMRLQVGHGLELRDHSGSMIESPYDWADFSAGEMKEMSGGVCHLHNVGNVLVNVAFVCDNCPVEWSLSVDGYINSNRVPWDSLLMELDVGENKMVWIELTEVSAIAGQDYSFDISFDVVDSP